MKWCTTHMIMAVAATATKMELKRYKMEKNASFCSGTNDVVSGTDRADMAEKAIAALTAPFDNQ